MIKLNSKKDCCGCTACASICPKQCITMQADDEGFLYPITDESLCTNCNACNKVCPIINKQKTRTPLQSYAAKNRDREVLLDSSSGGIFSQLAEQILDEGGVVFGAAWVDGKVEHTYIEKPEELYRMRGSKYVQSDLKDTFRQARQFLRDGRLVLVTGTPCEIGGLKSFLKKDYDNLLALDVACHGAPSPKVLSLYMRELECKYGSDVQLNFRSKRDGWQNYKVTAYTGDCHHFYEGQKENIFMKGFLRELYSRPACHDCAFKGFRSQSDITLADFWGIEEVLPELDHTDGVSLVLLNTEKGRDFFSSIERDLDLNKTSLTDALNHNGALLHTEESHPERKYFFRQLGSKQLTKLIEECLALRTSTRCKLRIQSYLHKLGL